MTTFCSWKPHAKGFICKNEGCGRYVQTLQQLPCKSASGEERGVVKPKFVSLVDVLQPSLLKKASSWASSITTYIKAGQPTRTDEEVQKLLAICEDCEHYDASGVRAHCRKCGCCVNNRSIAWINKLAMATEKCPIGKW